VGGRLEAVNITIVLLIQKLEEPSYRGILNKVLNDNSEELVGEKRSMQLITVKYDEENRDTAAVKLSVCKILEGTGISVVVDMTYSGSTYVQKLVRAYGIPYVKADITVNQYLEALKEYLERTNALEIGLLFENKSKLNQGLLYLSENSFVSLIAMSGLDHNATVSLKNLKPSLTDYALIGTPVEVQKLFTTARESGLMRSETKWHIMLTKFGSFLLSPDEVTVATIFTPNNSLCNPPSAYPDKGESSCYYKMDELLARRVMKLVKRALMTLSRGNQVIPNIVGNCNVTLPTSAATNPYKTAFDAAVETALNDYAGKLHYDSNPEKPKTIRPDTLLDATLITQSKSTHIGSWNWNGDLNLTVDLERVVRRVLRVGVVLHPPFTMQKKSLEGFPMKTDDGEDILEGYCIDLTMELAGRMNFDATYVREPNNHIGFKDSNTETWNGLIKMLQEGHIDLAVAPMTMTSEREEVVDFVSPHFEQTGILIAMRLPEKDTSLFKFMAVLRPEVWWCLLGAIIATAVVLYIVDRFSPFSGNNNKKRFPYECRRFTLSECLWFAVASLTPQGGGEPPKSLSGRILASTYWLFVVLMLATFTSNLAAFLTVERMKTSINSLDDLASSTVINYTTVGGSMAHKYFENMKAAEDEIYNFWKTQSLSNTETASKFQVWNYPIKEVYSRMWEVIERTGTVDSPDEGFERLKKDTDGKFAFIHDALQVRYRVYQDCNFVSVGETFAEQPYGIAVPSDSQLKDELSKVILEMQKDRVLEVLAQRYWNSNNRKQCDGGSGEGLILANMGGVFIFAGIGLVIGLIALVVEVRSQSTRSHLEQIRKKEDISKKIISEKIELQNKSRMYTTTGADKIFQRYYFFK